MQNNNSTKEKPESSKALAKEQQGDEKIEALSDEAMNDVSGGGWADLEPVPLRFDYPPEEDVPPGLWWSLLDPWRECRPR